MTGEERKPSLCGYTEEGGPSPPRLGLVKGAGRTRSQGARHPQGESVLCEGEREAQCFSLDSVLVPVRCSSRTS